MQKFITMMSVALVTALAGVVIPASAVGTVTVEFDDFVLPVAKECGRVPFQVVVPSDIPDWTVDVTVYDAKGSDEGGGFYYADVDPNVISDYMELCKYNDPGEYQVVVEVETYDSNHASLGNYQVTDSFSFSKEPMVRSRFTVEVTPSGAHSWKILGRLTRASKPWKFHRTQLYVRLGSSWAKLSSKSTDRKGIVSWESTPKPGAGQYLMYLYAPGTHTTKPSASRNFRVYAR